MSGSAGFGKGQRWHSLSSPQPTENQLRLVRHINTFNLTVQDLNADGQALLNEMQALRTENENLKSELKKATKK